MEYDNTPTVNVVVIEVWDFGTTSSTFRGLVSIKRKDNNGWALPGGFQERPEHIQEAASREVREETQIDINPYKLQFLDIGTTPDGKFNLVFWRAAIKLKEWEFYKNAFIPNEEVSEIELKSEFWVTPFDMHTKIVNAVFWERR